MTRPNNNNNYTYLLITIMTGILAVMIAMVLAVVLTNPPTIQVVMTGPAGTSPQATPGTPSEPVKPGPAMPEIAAARLAAVPPAGDVYDKLWDKAPVVEVPLQPQMMAMPILETPTVTNINVQALRDNQNLAFRLSWAKAAPSSNVDTGRFSDAVALQLPFEPDTPFTMGAPGKPVRVLHWKALWQKDIDEHYQDVQDLHPNYWADMYWFTEGKFPFPIADAFKNPIARQWLVGVQSGNPMANFNRKQPVEEIAAEGFGSVTHLPTILANAKGVWKDGRWTVVIVRPLLADDPLAAAIQAGKINMVSFAVWDGTAQNVGGRKHYCTWIPLKVAQ